MVRELVVLGSASQVPTRRRNHNGYLLRWNGHGVLFDPGEGTQRQLLLAGVAPSAVTAICITHFHGDHCLGLPGVLQRLALDGVERPVPIVFPAAGREYFDRLRHASSFDDTLDVRPLPLEAPSDGSTVPVPLDLGGGLCLEVAALAHRIPTVGFRLVEPAGRTMVPQRLAAAGVSGPDIGRLERTGAVRVGGRDVRVQDVSIERPGQRAAVVMDTGWCAGALALADHADLLVCEATFTTADADVAARSGHLTAAQAGRLASEAGATHLLLAHFSQRYPDVAPLVAEARAAFAGRITAAEDLQRVALPARRRAIAR